MSFRRRFCQVPFVDNLFPKIEFRDVDVVCQNKVVGFKFVKTLCFDLCLVLLEYCEESEMNNILNPKQENLKSNECCITSQP